MPEIYYDPEEVWETALEMQSGFETLAECEEYGTAIYLEVYASRIVISADAEGTQEEFEVTNEDECREAVQDLYDRYLTPNFVNNMALAEEEISDEEWFANEIDAREDELNLSFDQLICDILGENYEQYAKRKDGNKIVEELKENVLRYLWDHYELEPYRPMILVDEDGNEEFEEFPYAKLYA